MAAADPAARRRIDAVAIHPYATTPLAALARVVQARRAVDGLRLASALYVTEFGRTTSPPGALDWAPQRLRPGYIDGTLEARGWRRAARSHFSIACVAFSKADSAGLVNTRPSWNLSSPEKLNSKAPVYSSPIQVYQ